MGFLGSLFSKRSTEGVQPETNVHNAYHSSLNWPDTKSWVQVDASEMKEGLTLLLPPTMKYYLHDAGITLWINERVTHSINTEGSYNSFDMQENRDWMNDEDNREDVVWLIDEPHFAYFTAKDVSASVKNKTTHSCFGEKWIDGQHFFMDVDGITIDDDFSYNLSQEECLTFVTIFRSIQK